MGEDFSTSQTAGANAMRKDIRDFYDLRRHKVRRQRTNRADKSISEVKISHMAQQPSHKLRTSELCE